MRRWPIPPPSVTPSTSSVATARSPPSWSSPRWRGRPTRSLAWPQQAGSRRVAHRRLAHRPSALTARRGGARRCCPPGRARADLLAYIGDVFDGARVAGAGAPAPARADAAHDRLSRLARRAAERAPGGRRARCAPAPRRSTSTPSTSIHTDERLRPGRARLCPRPTAQRPAGADPLLARGIVPVVPGFIGATPEGEVATLGRGGSDLTATLLARGLGAAGVSLWKDVPGLLTADPRVVPDARVIPQLHAREAARAGVLRRQGAAPPRADPASPAAAFRCSCGRSPIPTRRRHRGLGARAPARFPVKALSAAGGQALVTVAGNGMLGVPGIAARTFARAARAADLGVAHLAGVVGALDLLQRARAAADDARESLEREFHGEIAARRDRRHRGQRSGMATVAVVGLGMHGTPRHRGARCSRRSRPADQRRRDRAGIVGARTSPSSSRRAQAGEAQRRDPRRVPALAHRRRRASSSPSAWTWCCSASGRSAARWPRSSAEVRRPDADLKLRGGHRPLGLRLRSAGSRPARLGGARGGQAAGKRSADAPRGQAATAEEAIQHIAELRAHAPGTGRPDGRRHRPGARAGADPRHGPGARQQAAARRPPRGQRGAVETARARGRRVQHEATVGAGLPIIDTYHKLIESGDRVERIEGLLSGTLGYVLTEVSAGMPFSRAVRRGDEPRLHGAGSARRSLGRGRRPQGIDPGPAARLSGRAVADARSSRWSPSGLAPFRYPGFWTGSTSWTPPGGAGSPRRRPTARCCATSRR